MTFDVITVGGGLAGSALATALARTGHKVLVLERETRFKDRVRGENMVPWGVAAARCLGLVDDLLAAGGHWDRIAA
jgi:2-polyprenyl-6-methoxyphenol hydroxylase-like FAD-dependent oxidoreductase